MKPESNCHATYTENIQKVLPVSIELDLRLLESEYQYPNVGVMALPPLVRVQMEGARGVEKGWGEVSGLHSCRGVRQ